MQFSRRAWMFQTVALSSLTYRGLFAEEAVLVCARQTLPKFSSEVEEQEIAQVITTAKIHPNGQWIFSGGDKHWIAVWDSVAEKQIGTLTGHTDWIRGLAISASGELLASVGNDGRVLLWDTATRKMCAELQHFSEACLAVEFHPTDPQIAVATASGKVYWIDVQTRRSLHVFTDLNTEVRALAFSPDGKLLAAGNRLGQIHVWNLHDRSLFVKEPAHSQRVRSLIFSADNAGLLSAADDGFVKLTSLSTGFRGFHFPQQHCRIMAVAICHDNKIATAGSDNRIRLWDGKNRELLGEIGTHEGSVATLDCMGDLLVSGGFDTQLCLWHLSQKPQVQNDVRERVSARPMFRLQ
jgi:WD40 repeat protein